MMDSSTVFLSHPSHAVFNSLPATAVSFQSSCPSLWIEADSVTMATLPPSPGRPGPTHTNTVSSVGGRATTDCVCVYMCVCVCLLFLSFQAAFPRIHSILCPVGRVGGLGQMPWSQRMSHTRDLQGVRAYL